MDSHTAGAIAGVLFGVGLIALLLWFLKCQCLDKRPLNDSTSAIGTSVYMDFLNQDKKNAVKHILYMKEDWEEKDGEGDDVKRFNYLRNLQKISKGEEPGGSIERE